MKTFHKITTELGKFPSKKLFLKKFHNYGTKIKNTIYYSSEEELEIIEWINKPKSEKIKETCLEKYNVENFTKSPSFKENLSKKKRSNTEEFIKKAKLIHKENYDYSLVKYGRNAFEKVIIICKEHGEFEMSPHNFLAGQNCPKCKHSTSLGEKKIEKYLSELNIRFIKQKRFFFIKRKRTLPFDFYLPDYNLVIEFQGRQHYEDVEFYRNSYQFTSETDIIKKKTCEANEIFYLDIKYNDKNYKEKINEYIGIW